jgi:hypothetical protein
MKKLVVTLVLLALVVALPGSRAAADGSARDLHQKLLLLEERVLTFDFKDKPLADVLAYFTEFTGVNLVLSPTVTADKSPEDLLVSLTLKKVSVKSALDIILELKGLAAVYRHGVIFVTTKADARGKPVLRIYSIGDLTVRIRDFPAPEIGIHPSGSEGVENMFQHEDEGKEHAFADPDFIMDLITQNAGEDTWNDKGVSYSANERYLFIRQYPSVHREIAGILDLLRAYR